MTFNFLHFTDWHQGQQGQQTLWQSIESEFFDDLKNLAGQAGPWDAILFTGDLTQRGSQEEFDALDGMLERLFNVIKELQGFRPELLAVPGNHDLIRPVEKDHWYHSLHDWSTARDQFYKDPTFRQPLVDCFKPYSQWWERRRPNSARFGLLPGDFLFEFEKEGRSIGIVGLNSTFLQFRDKMTVGSLDIDIQQLLPACDHDLAGWSHQRDLTLLMTHHPPAWLSPDALESRYPGIMQAAKIQLHLYGHMHDARAMSISMGGASYDHTLQGRSLFGLEWIETTQKLERSHGYLAGRLTMDTNAAQVTLWPRVGQKDQANRWRLIPDHSYALEQTFPRITLQATLILNQKDVPERKASTASTSPLLPAPATRTETAKVNPQSSKPAQVFMASIPASRSHGAPECSVFQKLRAGLQQAGCSMPSVTGGGELTKLRLKSQMAEFLKAGPPETLHLAFLEAELREVRNRIYLLPADAEPGDHEESESADLISLSALHPAAVPPMLWCVGQRDQGNRQPTPEGSSSALLPPRFSFEVGASAVVLSGSTEALSTWLLEQLQAGKNCAEGLTVGTLWDAAAPHFQRQAPQDEQTWRTRFLLLPRTRDEVRLDPWRQALEEGFQSPPLSSLSDAQRMAAHDLVTVCRAHWEKQAQHIPWDPWRDEQLPVRTLGQLPRLLRRSPSSSHEETSSSAADLNGVEACLLMVMPFVREAVLSAGACWLEDADPLTLTSQQSPAQNRQLLEQEHARHPALLRQHACQGDALRKEATARWLVHRLMLRTPKIWETADTGPFPKDLKEALERLVAALIWDAHYLPLSQLLRLAQSLGTHPERLEQSDQVNPLITVKPRDPSGIALDIRLLHLGMLLCQAGWMALDRRSLEDLLVEHIVQDVDFPVQDALQALAEAAWLEEGGGFTLRVACPHPAVEAAIRSGVQRADDVLTRLHSKGLEPTFELFRGLPSRLTAWQVQPSLNAANQQVYSPPLVRFQLEQDRIRELLMGVQLYGDPSLAIRELYQNALDACRYRQARTDFLGRMGKGRPYTGQIKFRQWQDKTSNQVTLECRDNGVGMGRFELEHLFARAGQRFQDVPEFLEEQVTWMACQPPVELYPNSQFGIGVLSYFMLADELEVLTRRFNQNGELGDPLRVRIASRGGILRIQVASPQDMPDAGTRVTLKLAQESYPRWNKWTGEEASSRVPIHCTQILTKLLWISEFYTETSDETADEDERFAYWKKGVLGCQNIRWLKVQDTGTPNVWWAGRKAPVLVDGIQTDSTHPFLLLNLVGKQYPRLSVDRRFVLDKEALNQLPMTEDALVRLASWEHLSFEKLGRLAELAPPAFVKVLQLLWEQDAQVRVDVWSDDQRVERRPIRSMGSWFLTSVNLNESDSEHERQGLWRARPPYECFCAGTGLHAYEVGRGPVADGQQREHEVNKFVQWVEERMPFSWRALAQDIHWVDGLLFQVLSQKRDQAQTRRFSQIHLGDLLEIAHRYEQPLSTLLQRLRVVSHVGLLRCRLRYDRLEQLQVGADDHELVRNAAALFDAPITPHALLRAFFALGWPLPKLVSRLLTLTPAGLTWEGLDPARLQAQLHAPSGWPTLLRTPTGDDYLLLARTRNLELVEIVTAFTLAGLLRALERSHSSSAALLERARAWSDVLQWPLPDTLERLEQLPVLSAEERSLIFRDHDEWPVAVSPCYPPGLLVEHAYHRRCTLREVCAEVERLVPFTPPLPPIDWAQVQAPETYLDAINKLGIRLSTSAHMLQCPSEELKTPLEAWQQLKRFIPLGFKVDPVEEEALVGLRLSNEDWALLRWWGMPAMRRAGRRVWPRSAALFGARLFGRPLTEVQGRIQALSALGLEPPQPLPPDLTIEALDDDDWFLLGLRMYDTGDDALARWLVTHASDRTESTMRHLGWYLPDLDQRIDRFRRWALLEDEPDLS